MSVATADSLDPTIYDLSLNTLDGQRTTLGEYRGKFLLIVNVASRCGFTPQYEGLEALYRKYKNNGVVVLGFPCNQFGGQEPGTESEIQEFCSTQYQVTFPVFAKIDVNGKTAHPIYSWLKSRAKGIFGTEAIKWNFTKFLVDRQGNVVERFGSNVTPAELDLVISELVD